MADVYSGFKFDIGDHLLLAKPDGWVSQEPIWSVKDRGDGRMRLHVVGRLYDECPGGVQLHYDCRVTQADGSISAGLLRFNESEVEKWSPIKKVDD